MSSASKSRKAAQKEMRKQTSSALSNGVPFKAQQVHIGAVAIAIRDKLHERQNPRRGGDAARIAHKVFDRSTAAATERPAIACRVGCTFCCYLYVSATAPEVLLIAHTLRSSRSAAEIEAIVARCLELVGQDVDSRYGRKIPCPLLENGRCSVYEVRPLACRMFTSMSAKVCEAAFNGSDEPIRRPAVDVLSGNNAKLALRAAIEAIGQPNQAYELGEALAIALSQPSAEHRWLNGEDVFADCRIDTSRGEEIRAQSSSIADIIR